MDFDLDDFQTSLVASLTTLFERFAGPERAQEAERAQANGERVLRELDEAGFLDLYHGAGPLEAVFVVEEAARAAVVAPIAARVLVAPALLNDVGALSVALAVADTRTPLARYAPGAELILLLAGDEALVMHPSPDEVEVVTSPFGYPLGRLRQCRGTSLGPGSGDVLLRWWRVALSAESGACMSEALRRTVSYVSERSLFGKTLGSHQAVQHRLAELHIRVEATKWLAREAASTGAPMEKASVAAAFAAESAKLVIDDCHQFHGAMGLTLEYPLHLWTMRLQALRVELGGAATHQRAVTVSM